MTHPLAAAVAVLVACSTVSARAEDDAWTQCMTAGPSPAVIVSACTRALTEHPDASPAQRALFLEARSDALMKLHEDREALAGYSAAIKLDPHDMEAYRSRGAAWLAVNAFALAVRDFSRALRYRNPQADETTVADVYYGRAAAFHGLGRPKPYLADCAAARRLDHRSPRQAHGCP